MQRSIRYQIVGLVGAMLIGALATYLVIANRIVSTDLHASLVEVTRVMASSLAERVGTNLQALTSKLKYFAKARPPPEQLFEAADALYGLRVVDGLAPGAIESFRWPPAADVLGGAAEPFPGVEPYATRIQNVSTGGQPRLRITVATAEHQAVVADVLPERLLKPERNPMFRVYLLDDKAAVLAHSEPQAVLTKSEVPSEHPLRAALQTTEIKGHVEYVQGDQQWLASWERLPFGGVVVAEAPRDAVFQATRALTTRALMFGALMIGFTILLAVYFSRRVSAPLQALERTIERISRGELGAEVNVSSSDEIGTLARSFNQMSRELARRSEELDTKNAQLVQSEKMSAIGELSAGLAHEVKNPMVGIVGFAQLGQESTSLDEAREYFKLIDNDAQRANGILQNLLEFARPPDVEQEMLEINLVVAGAVRLTAHQLQLNGVKVHTSYSEGLPKVRGNANQLRQVLLNLMMNASQAMEGTKDKHLYVETKGGDAGAQISVRDVGPGIAPETKARLFEPFFTTKPRGKGTGLGLSISRSIIESHHGELRVESELGKGATFYIRLPSADDHPDVSGPFRIPDDIKATRH